MTELMVFREGYRRLGRAGGGALRRLRRTYRRVKPGTATRFSWLFIATLPNSGSTALAELLLSSPRTIALNGNAEGQWLLPEVSAPALRWDPETEIDYARLRKVWIDRAHELSFREAIVVEKSPPNLVRFRQLIAAFSDTRTNTLRLLRDPYAICASWSKREPAERLLRDWAPHLRGTIVDETSYYRALGAICGERLEKLAALDDMIELDVYYESLVDDPGRAAEELLAAFPALGRLNANLRVKVKDYGRQPLKNMNEEQIARLAPDQLVAITEGLAPFEASLSRFGYRLR